MCIYVHHWFVGLTYWTLGQKKLSDVACTVFPLRFIFVIDSFHKCVHTKPLASFVYHHPGFCWSQYDVPYTGCPLSTLMMLVTLMPLGLGSTKTQISCNTWWAVLPFFLESHGNHYECVLNYTCIVPGGLWSRLWLNIPVNGTYIWLKQVYKISLQAYD